jgi:hypothetical protein
VDTHGEAELILGRTAKSAGGRTGWLTLGRGVYCCEREEGAESEEKRVHHLRDVGLGRKPAKDGGCDDPYFIQGLSVPRG